MQDNYPRQLFGEVIQDYYSGKLSKTIIRGSYPRPLFGEVIQGYYSGKLSEATIRGSYPWLLFGAVIQDYYSGRLSKTIIQGSYPWLFLAAGDYNQNSFIIFVFSLIKCPRQPCELLQFETNLSRQLATVKNQRERIFNSTRRLRARPSSVVLVSIGLLLP